MWCTNTVEAPVFCSLVFILQMGLLGWLAVAADWAYLFENPPQLLSIAVVPFCTPLNSAQGSDFSTSLTALVIFFK